MATIRRECPEFVLYLARVIGAMVAQTESVLTESGGVDDLSYELWLKHAKYSLLNIF